jgi:hypothetical protein
MTIMQRIGAVSASIEVGNRAREFVSLARCLALAKGSVASAEAIAREARLSPTVINVLSDRHKVWDMPRDLVLGHRAAVAAGTTTDATWAAPLADFNVLANAFLESLRSFGAFDGMLPFMRRVPFRSRIGVSTVGITGTTVPQGHVKPISSLTVSGDTLDDFKAIAILVITAELARFSEPAAGDLFAVELSNAVAVETDETFVGVLTTGATSIGSSGSTAEHVRNDLRALLAAVTTSARSRLFLLTTPAIAKVLSVLHTSTGDAAFPGITYRGGDLAGITVIASDGVPSATMVLVDAAQIVAASDTIQLDAASHASVQFETAPDSPPTASTNLQSLWQQNMLGLKASRYFAVNRLATTGVAVLTGASYLGDSPGP